MEVLHFCLGQKERFNYARVGDDAQERDHLVLFVTFVVTDKSARPWTTKVLLPQDDFAKIHVELEWWQDTPAKAAVGHDHL